MNNIKDIDKFKQMMHDFSVGYKEYYRDEKKFYPIYNVNVLTIESNLVKNDCAYGVGLEVIFDKDGNFIGFEPYGDQ